jgi:hypothetical protein
MDALAKLELCDVEVDVHQAITGTPTNFMQKYDRICSEQKKWLLNFKNRMNILSYLCRLYLTICLHDIF